MNDQRSLLPKQRSYDIANELACQLAREKLAKIQDIEQQCKRVGAEYQLNGPQRLITIKYLNDSYLVTFPQGQITQLNGGDQVPVRDRVLMLHYLTSEKDNAPATRLITYKNLPGGNTYFPTFSARTIKPMLKYFGSNPRLLVEAVATLGGNKADIGDVSVTINAFPRVPIIIVFWQGDDEFPAEGSIIFDAVISDYLPIEDITVVCEIIARKLIGYIRKQQEESR